MIIGGKVISLFTASNGAEDMTQTDYFFCLAGKGIEGDRYAKGTGTFSKKPEPGRQLTIIESEGLEMLKHLPDLICSPHQYRRNIVSRGIRLNSLVGRKLSIGEVSIKVHRLCQPCSYLEGMLNKPGLKSALWGKGGIRCEILSDGKIMVEDSIRLI